MLSSIEYSVYLYQHCFCQVREVLTKSKVLVSYHTLVISIKSKQQAGAELGQAQVKLNDIVVIVFEVVVTAMVEVGVQLLFRVGGWSDKTKLILISTLVEVVVEVEVELGKILCCEATKI